MTSPVRSLRMRTRNRRLINPTVGLGDILEERRTNKRTASEKKQYEGVLASATES